MTHENKDVRVITQITTGCLFEVLIRYAAVHAAQIEEIRNAAQRSDAANLIVDERLIEERIDFWQQRLSRLFLDSLS